MFFVTLLVGFVLCGTLLSMIDTFLPGFFMPMVAVMMRWTGIILIWTGIGVYLGRNISTGGSKFDDLANPMIGKLIHVGKSSGRILNARKTDPNRLVSKVKRGFMNIKDTGDPINIAGHDVFITSQDIGHNIPLWLCDLIDKWKNKYGVRNEDEWKKLYDQIKNIKTFNDLDDIVFLKPIMADPERRKLLFDMTLDDIRNMRERLFDGRVINAKAYIGWAEGATPYDNESIIDSTVAHYRAQDMSLRALGGAGDYMKYIIPFAIILILGAIAYQIFGGG